MPTRNLRFAAAVWRAMVLRRYAAPVSLRMRVRARLIRLAMLLSTIALAAGSVAACGASGTPEIVPLTGPLVTVQMRGGMCQEGMCDNTVILERDGKVHSAAKPPNSLGLVPPVPLDALNAAITAADWATLRSKPFTGECPVNFDGQELIFEFSTLSGTQRLASCEVEIEWGSPLFIAVVNALGEWIAVPLL
jgi:hypothetical protein